MADVIYGRCAKGYSVSAILIILLKFVL